MGWHNIIKFLQQVNDHSTLIAKYWISSFFLIRMLIVFQIGKSAWSGSQGGFVCNTQSPGCKNVCFNEYSPIALPTYWSVQLLFVALPSVMFIVYTAYKVAQVDKAIVIKRKKEKEARETEKKQIKAKIEEDKKKGFAIEAVSDSENDDEPLAGVKIVSSQIGRDVPTKLFLAYFFMVVARMVIDIAFVVGQYFLYTFKFVMPELWQCQHWPCPNVVDCFVSRPKEKTVFICLFYASCCIMTILSVMELYHIGAKFPEAWSKRHEDVTKDISDDPTFGGYNYNTTAAGYNTGYPDVSGIPTVYPVQRYPRAPGARGQQQYRTQRALGGGNRRRRY